MKEPYAGVHGESEPTAPSAPQIFSNEEVIIIDHDVKDTKTETKSRTELIDIKFDCKSRANTKIGMSLQGNEVARIFKGSLAERQGVKVGWTIAAINSEPILETDANVKQRIEYLLLSSQGKYGHVIISFQKSHSSQTKHVNLNFPLNWDSLGLALEGRTIIKVQNGKTAAKLGVKPGWKIESVGNQKCTSEDSAVVAVMIHQAKTKCIEEGKSTVPINFLVSRAVEEQNPNVSHAAQQKSCSLQ
mmetsp:Transcript_17258/g.42298  ORF Transcript_17258/g.42298 Transcript_17258/m.42298 type:complete len:245 (-) Transcript_17258:258-992(-)|eukprot:CAMPEP_0114518452 /NCGR_PEP_ID=MMETSP0109-20121206/18453_1 /TAXON_ID=29199 /ORGANISM="Chlorarachnion reptans, Strain CCCM449" /LENGTH=244 /DNA_ID=CAMNT_0001699077 /DNA_START=169 /DNA_END=903 /DNA_ORIENTATION=+